MVVMAISDDLERDLGDYLAEVDHIPDFDNDSDDEWMPDGEEEADRLVRHLGRAEAEEARLRAFHAAQVAKLDEWLADRLAGQQRIQAGARRALEGWCRKVWAGAGGHVWNLPSGVLRLTAPRQSMVVSDEPAALAWLEEHAPQAVRKAVDKTEAKALLRSVGEIGEDPESGRKWYSAADIDGEIVPGVRFEAPVEHSFSVKARTD